MSLRDRAAAWWSAWKYVAILAVLLALSAGSNVHLLRVKWSASADCRAGMERAARIAIENERKRAAADEKRAGQIAATTKQETAHVVIDVQGDTNARESKLLQVPVAGACIMPAGGMPSIQPAIDAANAAAGD